MNPVRLEQLIASFLDRAATAEELAELDALLSADPLAATQLAESARIDALLSDRLSGQERAAQFTELLRSKIEAVDRSASQANAAKLPVAPPPALSTVEGPTRPFAPPPKSPVLGFLAPIARRIPGGEATVGGLVVFVIAVAFWGLANKIMYPDLGGQDLAHEDLLPSPPEGEGSGVRGRAPAKILSSEEVEWSPRREASLPPAIRRGEALSIDSGLVELELKQGVTLLIEGPATWSIDGNNNATLKRGKLVAKVPQQAIGFTLETPTAKIVDLSTEFGVEVGESGVADVQVLKGQVDVQGAKGSTKQGPGILKAGQSVRITNQGVATIETSSTVPDRFKRLIDAGNKQVPGPLATNPTTGLVAYYPFDGDTRDHAAEYAANSGKTADDLKINGPSEFLAGQVGRGLRLTGGYCAAPIAYDLQLPPTFTIEAWIVAEHLTETHQRLVLNWGSPGASAYHFGLFGKQVSLFVGQAGGQHVKTQGGELKIQRWEHVAAMADGKLLRVYLNGGEVGTQPYDGTLFVNTTQGLGVGDSATEPSPSIRFRGCIDDMAIWRIPLSAEQIAEHVRSGRHGIELISSDRKEANASQPPP